MTQGKNKRIGLIVGREKDWPGAFMKEIETRAQGLRAEMVKLGGTFMDDDCPYAVIIDRMSQIIPYFRTYVKYAAMHGSYIINDPFVWSSDSRFFGTALANRLGLKSPKTIVLPNKDIATHVVPDSFRNLEYPMDWEGIINYVGVPAMFKETRSGGRRLSFYVHSVEDLIQNYDESGTRTMMIQEIVNDGEHIHSFVIGQENVLTLRYSHDENRYYDSDSYLNRELKEQVRNSTIALTQAYGYDINMIEYILREDDLYLINATNPAPEMDRTLMTDEQFDWIVNETVSLAIERVLHPLPQRVTFKLNPIEK